MKANYISPSTEYTAMMQGGILCGSQPPQNSDPAEVSSTPKAAPGRVF